MKKEKKGATGEGKGGEKKRRHESGVREMKEG